MKVIYSPLSTLTRSVISLLLGFVLVIWPEQVNSTIITILGIILLLPFVGALLAKFLRKKDEAKAYDVLPIIGGGGSAVLGILMIIMPNTFTSLLALFIGIMLFFAGITQIIGVFTYCRVAKSFWLMLLPLITMGVGLYAITNFTEMAKTLWIILGVMIILYGVSEILNYFKVNSIEGKNSHIEEAEIIE